MQSVFTKKTPAPRSSKVRGLLKIPSFFRMTQMTNYE